MNKFRTAKEAEHIAAPGRYRDGESRGLYLQIRPNGRSWILRYRNVAGRQRDMGLGATSDVTLADARRAVHDIREKLRVGIDPIAAKAAARDEARRTDLTFRQFIFDGAKIGNRHVEAFADTLTKTSKNDKHKYQIHQTLSDYAKPLHPKRLIDVTQTDVAAVIAPLWIAKHETADRLLSRLNRAFIAAKAHGLIVGDNPANPDVIRAMLPKWKGRVEHFAAVPWHEMPGFVAELRKLNSTSARALLFTILTAARTSEVIEARWREFDLGKRLWIVPAGRMKGGEEHTVPLTPAALAILQSLPHGKPESLAFKSSRTQKPLSNVAMLQCLRGLRPDVTTHGFRSSFRDWAGDSAGAPREVAEMCLAHAVGSVVERSYRRGTALEARRKLLTRWENFLFSTDASNVVNLSRPKAG